MTKILQFTGQCAPIFQVCHEIIEINGRMSKRKRWIVVRLETNGDSSWYGAFRGKSDAEFIANLLAKKEEEDGILAEEQPLYAYYLSLPEDERREFSKLVQAAIQDNEPATG